MQRQQTQLKYFLAALVVLVLGFGTASHCAAALIHYEVTLTTDSDYTAFGGGLAGDQFYGTFSFDDSLLALGTQSDPASLTYSFDIHGTIFNDTLAQFPTNTLYIDTSGVLLNIEFGFNLPTYESFSIFTAGTYRSWIATDYPAQQRVRGEDFSGIAVTFNQVEDQVPEPGILGLFGFGLLTMGLAVGRRRRKVSGYFTTR